MLQARGGQPEPVQRGVDLVDDRDRVAGGDVDGLDEDPRHPVAEAAGGEALGVLDGPHAGLDADAGVEQRPHGLRRAVLGEVDRGVVRGAPARQELEPAPEIGLDPGAGRDAHRDAAGVAHRRDDGVDHPRVEPLGAVGVARVQVDGLRTGRDARGAVARELLPGDGQLRMEVLAERAVEGRLQQHRGPR